MGLIKLPFTSITSTLHDNWEDYITCSELNNDTLIVKKKIKNGIISNKIRIEVKPNQFVLVFSNGKIIDATKEAGIYTFEKTSAPALYLGSMADNLKDMMDSFKDDVGEQVIIYINTKEIIDNKFGSSSLVAYNDPKYNNIYIRFYGNYSFKIVNPFVFVSNFIKSDDIFTREELIKKTSDEFMGLLGEALRDCSDEGIVFSNLHNQSLIIKHLNEALKLIGKDLKGIEFESIDFHKIAPDDESLKKITNFNDKPLNSNNLVKENKQASICPNCHNPVVGKFCSECGIRVN